MEKLRSRPAYSIVAELRSTALRRVTTNVLDHRRTIERSILSLSAKTRENQRLNTSRSQTSQMGDLTSCSTASIDGSGAVVLRGHREGEVPRREVPLGSPTLHKPTASNAALVGHPFLWRKLSDVADRC
jgi:hypothetical protein